MENLDVRNIAGNERSGGREAGAVWSVELTGGGDSRQLPEDRRVHCRALHIAAALCTVRSEENWYNHNFAVYSIVFARRRV